MDYRMRVFRYGEDWVCEFPDLPGCTGIGNSPAEAVEDAAVAKELWLEVYLEDNGHLPSPSDLDAKDYSGKWVQRVGKTLHRNLVLKAEEEGVSLNTLCSTLLAEGIGRMMVNKCQIHKSSN